MIQRVKKYLIIRSYMRKLSRELARRFGRRPFYSIEHVSQAVQRGKLSAEYIPYAHAAYCSDTDFAAYYRGRTSSANYFELRNTIARRYFWGDVNFDAETIIRKFQKIEYDRQLFGESGLGDPGAGGGH